MIIEEKDFRFIQIDEHSDAWDVEVLTKIQPKGKETRWEFKNIAYAVSLKGAIKRVIQYKINKKHSENKIISLKEYMKEYLETTKEVEKIYLKYFKDGKEN